MSLVIMMDGWMTRERGPDWGAGARADALRCFGEGAEADFPPFHDIEGAVPGGRSDPRSYARAGFG